MEQLFEFVGNHLLLVSAFFILLAAFLFLESKKGGQGISTHETTLLLNRKDALVVDLRPKAEFSAGHVINAVSMPYASLATRLPELEKHKDKPVVLVCKIGQHSRAAYKEFVKAGFTDVRRMNGGMAEWQGAGLPMVKG